MRLDDYQIALIVVWLKSFDEKFQAGVLKLENKTRPPYQPLLF